MSECICHNDRPCFGTGKTVAELGVLGLVFRIDVENLPVCKKDFAAHSISQSIRTLVLHVVLYAAKLYRDQLAKHRRDNDTVLFLETDITWGIVELTRLLGYKLSFVFAI